jgi:TfoX/Sxy family transcriptional regulator of competence genes
MAESLMASTKEYRDFILEQLSEASNITCRPMMGEFLLYSDNVLFGGIYDDRLLVKIVPENEQYKMSEEIPYDGAKPMYLVENVDDKNQLAEIVKDTVAGLLDKK